MVFRFLGFVVSIALLLLVKGAAYGQSYSTDAVADSIITQTWRPLYTMPSAKAADNKPVKYKYLSFADLVRWQEQGIPIRAIDISDQVTARGGWHDLAKLRDLQFVNVGLGSQLTLDSLMAVLNHLPIQRIGFIAVYSANSKRQAFVIPASVASLTTLSSVSLPNMNTTDLKVSLQNLAAVRSLRFLQLNLNANEINQLNQLPAELGKLTQLSELSLSVPGPSPTGLGCIGNLVGLKKLTVSSYNYGVVLSEPERKAFGDGVLKLVNLQELTMLANWLPHDYKPDWKNLRKLNLLTTTIDRAPFPSTGAMPVLERLRLQNVVLPENLCSWTKLNQLSISDEHSMVLPDCLGNLKALQSLIITGRGVKQLPATIGQLTSLTALHVMQTAVDSLPDVLSQLNQLTVLNLSNNQLKTLPPSVLKVSQLINLNLANNKLTELPEDIGRLSKLRSLAISQNQLTRLPDRLATLTALCMLFVDNNKLGQLPADLGRLGKLNQLNVSENQLTALPASLGSLDSLAELHIADNKLTSLPESIGNLKALRSINFNNNQLRQLPESIGNLSQLKMLHISDNPLESLPTTIGNLTALTELYIHTTKIKLLPTSIGRLSQLWSLRINSSPLITLPSETGNCQRLTSISLENTPLIGLPESLGRLKQLTNLSVSGPVDEQAKLMELPDSLQFCPALTNVQIRNFPNLSANEVFSILLKIHSLEQLSMEQTPLHQLPATGWKESSINMLNVARNNLTELPPAILDAPKLRFINLMGNPLPKSVDGAFQSIDQLRVVMADAGWVTLEGMPRKNWSVAQGFMQVANRKMRERDWAGADSDMEQAVSYAPDTLLAVVYAQRAEFAFFQKQYDKALTNFDQALVNWILFRVPTQQAMGLTTELAKKQLRTVWCMRKSMIRQLLGQTDAALSDINEAITELPTLKNGGMSQQLWQTEAQVFTEKGKLLAARKQFVESDSAYRRAMRAYEFMAYPDPGSKLTIVELGIVLGEYDRAHKVLDTFQSYQREGGNGVLYEYLNNALAIAEGKKSGAEAMQAMKRYIGGSSGRIINWSFDLFDAWLNRTTLPTDKRDALRELTAMAKERQVKMN